MKNHIIYGLKRLFIAVLFFGFGGAYSSEQSTTLTLKHAGAMNTHGAQSDIKLTVYQGSFPETVSTEGYTERAGDIIVNEADPSLLGFLHSNPSPIDAAVFHAAGGGLMASKGKIVFDSEIVMPEGVKNPQEFRQRIRDLFAQDQIVYQDEAFVVKSNVPSQLKAQIERYIQNGALIYEKGSIAGISLENNRLKKEIENLKAQRKLPVHGVIGSAYRTSALNIQKAQCIIHAVVPQNNDPEMLRTVIKNTLTEAVEFAAGKQIVSIAFPSLAIHYGFSLQNAASIIVAAVAGFVQSNGRFPIEEIRFVVNNDGEYATYAYALFDYAQARYNKQANDNAMIIEQCGDTCDFGRPVIKAKQQKVVAVEQAKVQKHQGFFDTMKQIGWDTSLLDLPGIFATACKNGWYGPAKESPADTKQQKPVSWGHWVNKNFNALCFGALGLLAIKQCI